MLYAIVQNANPLSVLIDPTLAIPNQQITFSQSLFGTDPLFMWFALGLLVFLSLSMISRSSRAHSGTDAFELMAIRGWLSGLIPKDYLSVLRFRHLLSVVSSMVVA